MPSTDLRFASAAEHRAWLQSQAALPRGFRVGSTRFEFTPVEVHKPAKMTLTLIALDEPTTLFGAMFTKNAFPGAPILVGRRRLNEPTLSAIVVNNKISNVCAPHGEQDAETVCAKVAELLNVPRNQVLPSSTGVIGWSLPVDAMRNALPAAVQALQSESILPAAEGIVTTDLYPKIRCVEIGGGSIVGIAKGAGMIEPNLATMLVYILTDLALSRDQLRSALSDAVVESFNAISIDSDTSTSDTVVLLSSAKIQCTDRSAFATALTAVCRDLAEDVVRNGEGVHHVIKVTVSGAPDRQLARAVGKSVVNSPLFQCAVCGNDANVGRLIAAIGKEIGASDRQLDLSRCAITVGGTQIFANGAFRLDPTREHKLVAHLKGAELYASKPPPDGLTFRPQVDFPPHERTVDIVIDLGCGNAATTVFGSDRSHEYISENADYRS